MLPSETCIRLASSREKSEDYSDGLTRRREMCILRYVEFISGKKEVIPFYEIFQDKQTKNFFYRAKL